MQGPIPKVRKNQSGAPSGAILTAGDRRVRVCQNSRLEKPRARPQADRAAAAFASMRLGVAPIEIGKGPHPWPLPGDRGGGAVRMRHRTRTPNPLVGSHCVGATSRISGARARA